VVFWGQSGFGALDPSSIVRIAALAVVCASLGVQTITTGFLWGLLAQKLDAPDAAQDMQLALGR
jgi:hypothetical protein